MRHPGPAGREATRTVSPPTDGPWHPPVQPRRRPPGRDLFLLGVELETLVQGAAVLLVGLLLPPHAVRVLHPLLLGVPKQATGGAERPCGCLTSPHPPNWGSLLPANGVQSICCGVKGSLPWAPRASTLLLEFSVAPTSPEKDQAVGLRIFVSCDTRPGT